VAIGELFGRRVRARVGNQIVCDLSPFADQDANETRNLDVAFTVEKHTKLEPLKTSLTVWGLSRDVRDRMSRELDAANQVAYKTRREIQAGAIDILEGQEEIALASLVVQGAEIQIEAGYGLDFGTLATATILPDGLKHERDGAGWRTEITAQDNRFLWQNGFVSQTIAGGVSLYDYQRVIDASTAVLSGEESLAAFTAQFPELTAIKDIPGHKNGFVLHGAAQRATQRLSDVLGLSPFLNEFGDLIYLNPTATRSEIAVRHAPSTGVLSISPLGRGFQKVVSLLNHNLGAGRQVLLFDEDPDSPDPSLPIEIPVGGGVFRVDHVQHTCTSFEQPFYSEVSLRPTSIAPAANP
jgi:hypothetical protein